MDPRTMEMVTRLAMNSLKLAMIGDRDFNRVRNHNQNKDRGTMGVIGTIVISLTVSTEIEVKTGVKLALESIIKIMKNLDTILIVTTIARIVSLVTIGMTVVAITIILHKQIRTVSLHVSLVNIAVVTSH